MARFTIEQKKYSEAMKLLIDLYYRFSETDREQWFSDATIQLVAKIFNLTIPNFSPCLYIQEYSMFRFRNPDEKLRISEVQIEDFLSFMNAIHTDISNGIHRFFELEERIVKTQIKENINTSSNGEQIEATEHSKIKNMPLCKIIPPVSKEAGTKTQNEYLYAINMRLNDPPDEYESFRLMVNRDCALDEEFLLEDGLTISSPGYTYQDVFFRSVVKYILVKYQFLLGSFERIKICKQCEKLFLEKRFGAGEYCSGTCRKKHHDSLQVPEIRKCRERQNAWIRYKYKNIVKLPKVYYLNRDECEVCTGGVKGGDCLALKNKNKKAFKIIDKQR